MLPTPLLQLRLDERLKPAHEVGLLHALAAGRAPVRQQLLELRHAHLPQVGALQVDAPGAPPATPADSSAPCRAPGGAPQLPGLTRPWLGCSLVEAEAGLHVAGVRKQEQPSKLRQQSSSAGISPPIRCQHSDCKWCNTWRASAGRRTSRQQSAPARR